MIEKYYTIQEVMEKLNVTKMTLYRWEHRGLIRFTRIGDRTTRIAESELKKMLEEGSKRNGNE